MSFKIKTLNSISPVYRGILRENEYTVGSEVMNPDAILVRSADMHSYTPEDKLMCIGRAGAGVNNIPCDEMAEKGIVVFNAPGANANAVKELVLAGLLMSSRKITEGAAWCSTLSPDTQDLDKLVEAQKKNYTGPELAGKTLGVIGLGAIGVLVANMGVSLGMEVLGYDPFISIDHAWKLSREVTRAIDMTELIEKSDYLTIHVPLMDSTRNTIDATVLSRMKPGAALLNYARGGLVDTDAVCESLENGRLRVYATDFPSAQLIGRKGVIMTPHLGASTPESEDNCVRFVAKQIDDYLKTGSIVNSVNFPACVLQPTRFCRVTVLHKNVPNVLGPITSLFSSEGLNIENMVNQSRGAHAYTVVDLNKAPSDELIKRLNEVDYVYRVRIID